MRLLLSCLALGLVSTSYVASCNGDSTVVDAGPDVVIEHTYDNSVPEAAPVAPLITDIVAGAQHTCMLINYNAQYVTYCFGADAAIGGMKNGILATVATGMGQSPAFTALASTYGAGHTCGVDVNKQVWCWGDNSKGQSGQGNTNTPVATATLALDSQFGIASGRLLTAGTQSTCLVRVLDHAFECFGDNTTCESDLYDPDAGCSASVSTATPTTDEAKVFRNLALVALGSVHGCVVGSTVPPVSDAGADASTEGGADAGSSPGLFCFGDNASLESAPAGKTLTAPAVLVTSAEVVSVAAGDAYTCYVTLAHGLYCFGKNDVHQASPTVATSPIDPTAAVPITLPMSNVAQSVVTRSNETCVIDINGLVWCFGSGHGTNIDQVMGVKDVAKLVLGQAHACVIGHLPTNKASDPPSVICWGDNTNGQAGQTGGGTVSTPAAVMFPASP